MIWSIFEQYSVDVICHPLEELAYKMNPEQDKQTNSPISYPMRQAKEAGKFNYDGKTSQECTSNHRDEIE